MHGKIIVLPKNRLANRSGGFSLVELLVVIGIIALLLAIILPVVGKVRRQASATKCLAQTRQIVSAIVLYSNDFDGSLPSPGWQSVEQNLTPGKRMSNWLYNQDKSNDFFRDGDAQYGSLQKYLNTTKVFRCPDDHGPWIDGTVQNITSYLMNGSVCAFGGVDTSGKPVITTSILLYKADCVIFWEVTGSDKSGGNDSSSFPSERITDRHATGSNVGCADGHAETIAATLPNDPWQVELNKQYKNRLWCNPFTKDGH